MVRFLKLRIKLCRDLAPWRCVRWKGGTRACMCLWNQGAPSRYPRRSQWPVLHRRVRGWCANKGTSMPGEYWNKGPPVRLVYSPACGGCGFGWRLFAGRGHRHQQRPPRGASKTTGQSAMRVSVYLDPGIAVFPVHWLSLRRVPLSWPGAHADIDSQANGQCKWPAGGGAWRMALERRSGGLYKGSGPQGSSCCPTPASLQMPPGVFFWHLPFRRGMGWSSGFRHCRI